MVYWLLRMSFNSNKRGRVRTADRVARAERQLRFYLTERGLRYTAQRRLILAAALRSAGHFDAEELYERFRAGGEGVSRATVYRTLAHLAECGLIKELLQSRGPALYEAVYGLGHHDHMVCVECGEAIEFCDEQIEDLQRRICRRHDFKPLEHRMSIRGVCRKCRAAAKRKDK